MLINRKSVFMPCYIPTFFYSLTESFFRKFMQFNTSLILKNDNIYKHLFMLMSFKLLTYEKGKGRNVKFLST